MAFWGWDKNYPTCHCLVDKATTNTCESYLSTTYLKISRASCCRCIGTAGCLHYNRGSFTHFLGNTLGLSQIPSPHLLVLATSERFLSTRGSFRVILASESHWLQPVLVLSGHWWPTPTCVGRVKVRWEGGINRLC